jgi:ActR/RegA family two-component response regulator
MDLIPDIHAGGLPTLLLVHDQLIDNQALREALQKHGFDVSVVYNIATAFTNAKDDAPNFAVIDLAKPKLSGLALVQHLRTLNPDIVIVLLTSSAPAAFTAKAASLGVVRCLSKPVTIREVIAALELFATASA